MSAAAADADLLSLFGPSYAVVLDAEGRVEVIDAPPPEPQRPAPLTARQQAVVDFVHVYREAFALPPTLREIGEHFGFSPNGASEHLRLIARKGGVSYAGGGRGRTLRPLAPCSERHGLAILVDASGAHVVRDPAPIEPNDVAELADLNASTRARWEARS